MNKNDRSQLFMMKKIEFYVNEVVSGKLMMKIFVNFNVNLRYSLEV